MKKIFYLFLALVLGMSVASCESDGNETDNLIGTWRTYKLVNGEGYTTEWDEDNDIQMYISFEKDGTGKFVDQDVTYKTEQPFIWKMEGDVISTKQAGDDEWEHVTLLTLTKTEMVVESRDAEYHWVQYFVKVK